MLVPRVKTIADVETVLSHLRRWRRKKRVLTLKACLRTINILVMRGDKQPSEVFDIRARVLRALKQEQFRLAKESREKNGGETLHGELPDTTSSAAAMIEEHDLPAEKITGTGQNGRITKGDVKRYMDGIVTY